MTLRRFLSLERRLQSDNNLKIEYTKFIKEYIQLGHMELVQTATQKDRCYYLPHHAVFKESSTTTKLRVVFDASAKTDTNTSLNDVLLKGPCIQEELVSIMSRFRTYKYVITADIKKMYRQIWISKHQRDYQRILWRENPDQPINIYCLKTVTYGVITSPYLATACLKTLSEEEIQNYPEACRALSRDFYVDDFLGGASTISETIKLREDLISILKSAGFELCKWSSNESSLLNDVVSKNCNDYVNNDTNERVTKILGLYWNRYNDAYQYKVQPYDNNARITKRIILSEIASVFDPLGLISPVIIKLKIIMQTLWQLKSGWDTILPSDINIEWRKIRENLIQLNSLTINRSVIGAGEILDVELHGFADASTNAYGACLYLRVTNTKNKYKTNYQRSIYSGILSRLALPHFGGLWEAAVKSLKSHLYKSLGNAALTFEELNTLLVRIEAILNSRPLSPLSSDPSDMSALTPGHFLIGESLLALPERTETTMSLNNISRWRRVSQVAQHFWSRWSREYLTQLQERSKWSSSLGPKCEIGAIVLLRDDNLPPLQWSIGRVMDINYGDDGQVRVATVKTSRGDFKRAVRYLCPLPFEGNQFS